MTNAKSKVNSYNAVVINWIVLANAALVITVLLHNVVSLESKGIMYALRGV